jgi:hypothetical protein
MEFTFLAGNVFDFRFLLLLGPVSCVVLPANDSEPLLSLGLGHSTLVDVAFQISGLEQLTFV